MNLLPNPTNDARHDAFVSALVLKCLMDRWSERVKKVMEEGRDAGVVTCHRARVFWLSVCHT